MPKKISGEVVDVAERNPRRTVPEPLAEVCRKAMATAPSERHASAREMGDALRVWLDGRGERARRHQEAEALAAKGKDALAEYGRLQDEVTRAERAADEEAAKVKPWQPVSEKTLSWLRASASSRCTPTPRSPSQRRRTCSMRP